MSPLCSMCQRNNATTTLNPRLICPHRTCHGPVGWEERTSNCVLFLPPASQTVALTKYPFCAVSFHSDWTNWDLLTANPIRAGTSQSRLGICHPWHTGLPLPPYRPLSLWPHCPLAFFNMGSLIESPETGLETLQWAACATKYEICILRLWSRYRAHQLHFRLEKFTTKTFLWVWEKDLNSLTSKFIFHNELTE